MAERDWLARQFEEHRTHLRAVAYRMLGSASEADDAVQEAWIRLNRADTSDVENLGGWLTTVVARVSLDMLRSRKTRREEPLSGHAPDAMATSVDESDLEQDALLADSVGPALLVVLDTLAPAERLAFVLHDLFGVPFAEIAVIVGRSPVAAKKLASRARRRVHSAAPARDAEPSRQGDVVAAFLAASRGGDFDALLALLDPDIVVRADRAAATMGAPKELRGATAVLQTFLGRAGGARLALIDGVAGVAWAPGGEPRGVMSFTVADGKIVAIDFIAEPERLRQFDLVILND